MFPNVEQINIPLGVNSSHDKKRVCVKNKF